MTMNEIKRKRLEAKGWRLTGVKDFLGLSEEEAAFIEVKLRLAQSLRQVRIRKGLGQVQAAKIIRSSQSRVAKMEAGDPSVSVDLLLRSHFALGTSEKELGRIIARPLAKTR
jgi:DNA-binding XRE family transcriptional regulator